MKPNSNTSLTSSEDILEQLFIQDQTITQKNQTLTQKNQTLTQKNQTLTQKNQTLTQTNKTITQTNKLKINLKLLNQISSNNTNYKTTLQLILILQRILNTGKNKITLRQLIYKTGAFRNNDKKFSFSNSFGSSFDSSFSSNSSNPTPKKEKQNIIINQKQQSPSFKDSESLEAETQLFVSDQLTSEQKQVLIISLTKIKTNLSNTIYQTKINQIIQKLEIKNPNKKQNSNEQENSKKILTLNCLSLQGNKNPQIQEFITKGYQSLDGKFTSFAALYQFLSNQILPLIQRKILSISIRSHQQRESFIAKAIIFLSEYFLHQYVLEIKINKATLIENRIFVEKVFKQNFKRNQNLITKNLTNILNEALLCPSNMTIQLPLFRLLKRMYNLWGVISGGSSQFIQFKSDSDDIGQIIKYPLLINLKNISLYSKSFDNEDEIKQAAMFCYKILNLKQDLYLCNEIEGLSQMRYLKESKYFSSKAYAFSEQISRIYDTFDLRMGFWKYYKRIERGETWVYNVLIEKPNSLLIWQFWLLGYDIGFGIYKVQGMKKHTMEQFSKQVECKEILKLQKYTVSQSQPQKGFIFLKNGLYRLVFDNSYSSFRGKDLSYMILHLESEG